MATAYILWFVAWVACGSNGRIFEISTMQSFQVLRLSVDVGLSFMSVDGESVVLRLLGSRISTDPSGANQKRSGLGWRQIQVRECRVSSWVLLADKVQPG